MEKEVDKKEEATSNSSYCICCGEPEKELDSICLKCRKLNRYPDKIYGV